MQSHNNTRCIRNSKISWEYCLLENRDFDDWNGIRVYFIYIKWKILQIDKSLDNIESNYNIYFYLEVVFKQRICSNDWKFYFKKCYFLF